MDEDEQISRSFFDKLIRRFKRRVSFSGNARSGTVTYQDGEKTIHFYVELGGGDCLFYMVIPDKENWEQRTGKSVEERDEVLKYVAEETLRQQTTSSGAYYVIDEHFITFKVKSNG